MKILFYTRLEKNTGGDATFLEILRTSLFQKMPHGAEVHLCLSYDALSEERAKKIKRLWLENLTELELTGDCWFFKTEETKFETSVKGTKFKYKRFTPERNKPFNFDASVKSLDSNLTWYIEWEHEYYGRIGKETAQKLSEKPKSPPSAGTEIKPPQAEKMILELAMGIPDTLIPVKGKESALSESVELSPILVEEDDEALDLVEQNGYAVLHRKTQQSNYPIFVIETSDSKISYYKNEESAAKTFPLNINKLNTTLLQKLNKGGCVPLTDDWLRSITNHIMHIPDELLIPNEALQKIETKFDLSDDLKRQHKAREVWERFKTLTQSIDIFVIAGWAHLYTPTTATYLSKELEIPKECQILLSCAPGMSINANKFLTGLQNASYQNLHVFQPGIRGNAGFPILPILTPEHCSSLTLRSQWIAHATYEDYGKYIKDYFADAAEYDEHMEEYHQYKNTFLSGQAAQAESSQDKLIVIYCSKDLPGDRGNLFLQNIHTKEGDNAKELTVLLIGADKENYPLWKSICDERGFKTCLALPRTENSAVLMHGLQQAQYCMVTGAFTILEALHLKIYHCQYLAPPHMQQLDAMLEATKASRPELIEEALNTGKDALNKLGPWIGQPDHYFNVRHAWEQTRKTLAEWLLSIAEIQNPDPYAGGIQEGATQPSSSVALR
jgi:hypothetical protein